MIQNVSVMKSENQVSLDFIYEDAKLTTGGIKIKAYSNAGINADVAVDTANATVIDGSLKMVPILR